MIIQIQRYGKEQVMTGMGSPETIAHVCAAVACQPKEDQIQLGKASEVPLWVACGHVQKS
jgi:hypothetical protein